MYAEITVIVEGAVDEEFIATDETILSEQMRELEEEACDSGYTFEVHRQDHDHEQGIDCECAQYATDHRPYRVFNPRA